MASLICIVVYLIIRLCYGENKENKQITELKISFQFHHVQMDGMEACEFLDLLQHKINQLAI